MNLSCQRQTAVLLTPAVRMNSAVPAPSAVNSTIRPHVFLGAVPVRQDRAEQAAIGGAHVYGDACSHPIESHRLIPLGIPLGTQVSDFDH
jgi:hypothetical protein